MACNETLDFSKAMRDFRTMFPALDENLIESVLRANNGAVEDTIDQLLAISVHGGLIIRSTSEAKQLPTGQSGADFLPFSPKTAYSTTVRKRVYVAPLVGKLPNDFLRLESDLKVLDKTSTNEKPDIKLAPPDYATAAKIKSPKLLNNAYGVSPETNHFTLPSSYECQQQRYTMRTSRDRLGYCSSSGASFDSVASCSSFQQARHEEAVKTALRRQSKIFQDRMAENEWKRNITRDPELEQYLEDERIALMLQNEEFLAHLKNDPDFIAALEKDQHEKLPKKKSKQSNSRKFSLDANCKSLTTSCDPEPIEEADPFPYTKILPKPDIVDASFGEKLKCMSKDSKRKFAILAKKFIHKKKGAKAVIGTSGPHFPESSLLADSSQFDGEAELLVERDPSPDCLTGYNQTNDDSYNIGHNTELKEGRLFSAYR